MFKSTNNRPKVTTPCPPDKSPDEPLPHLKRDDPGQVPADKLNLPEAHLYNEGDNEDAPDSDPQPPSTPSSNRAPRTRLPLRV